MLLAIAAGLGMIAGIRLGEELQVDGLRKPAMVRSDYAIQEALRHIDAKYYGRYDEEKTTDDAIKSIVEGLDNYSYYFDQDRVISYREYVNSTFDGVGLETLTSGDSVFVSHVFPGSPAERSGIRPADVMMSLNSFNIFEMDNRILDSVLSAAGRNISDTLSLRLFRRSEQLEFDVLLRPEEIVVPTIDAFALEDPAALYIAISRFSKGTFRQFMDEIEHPKQEGKTITKLIIDLRHNPGGLIDEAVKILNQLIPEKDKLLLTTVNSQGRKTVINTNGRSFMNHAEIVVLIDAKSASASEIMAGVLQDYERAVILGDTSFGKGLIQQTFPLSNGGSLHLTTGEYILPSGRTLSSSPKNVAKEETYESLGSGKPLVSGKGVIPDILSEPTDCLVHRSPVDLRNQVLLSLFELNLLDGKNTQESLDEITDRVEENLLKIWTSPLSTECQKQWRENIRWQVWKVFRPDNQTLSSTWVDMEIKRAMQELGISD